MEFKQLQSRLSLLSARLHLMVLLVFGLLLANMLLTALLWQALKTRQIEITPFAGNGSYFKSETTIDAHYLSLMTENFINERLTVSPETVDAKHKRLLSFVAPSAYVPLLKQLEEEAKVIKAKTLSSSFDINRIRTQPEQLTAQVSGILKRFVGLNALPEKQITYQLRFRYQAGRLSILSFSAMKEVRHD